MPQFLEYWSSVRSRTRRIVQCIPGESIEWTYQPGKWTLGDLVRHLAAMERWMFAENVAGRPSGYPGCGPELARGKAAVIEYLDAMDRDSIAIFSALTDTELRQKCRTPGGVSITAWKWLRAMVEHEVHHRGQIYFMLGMLGIATPPLYGLTAEEVHARSAPVGRPLSRGA